VRYRSRYAGSDRHQRPPRYREDFRVDKWKMSSRVEASTYLALNHIFRKFLSHRVTTRIYFPEQNDAPALRRLHETIKRSKRATHLDKDLRIIATTSIRCFDFFRRAGLLQPFCGVPPGLPTSGIPAPSSRCKTASIACTRGACRIFCLRRRYRKISPRIGSRLAVAFQDVRLLHHAR
jgi:hypothetical protein